MNKFIILIGLLFITSQLVQSQIKYGVKGGINYNSNSFSDVKDDVLSGGKSKTGFHAGVFLRGKIPIIGLFIQPELVYTQLNSDVTFKPTPTDAPVKTSYTLSKIDIPVLFGQKILKFVRVFAGPSFQYIIKGDFDTEKIKDVDADSFSMGMQLGAGVDLGNLGVDIRWERAFSDIESNLLHKTDASKVNFDTRINQIIIGLSYKF